jgi:hypothetical protein
MPSDVWCARMENGLPVGFHHLVHSWKLNHLSFSALTALELSGYIFSNTVESISFMLDGCLK